MVTTQISSDSACKKLFRNNQRFAAFFNAIMFDGKQAIDYKTLQHQENDQSTFIDEALKEKIDIKRYRDMVKKVSINANLCILAIEHQSAQDTKMALRIAIYDILGYYNQLENGKKIVPTLTIVFYTGEKEWTAPTSLQGMMKDIPTELQGHLNDWKFKVVSLKDIDTSKISDRDMKDCIEMSKEMFAGNYEGLMQNKIINREMMLIAGAFTHTDIKEEDLPEGDEINMCEGMDRLFQRFENQGMEKGETIGFKKGERSGIEKGKREEKQNTLKDLLKVKLGTLSNPLEKQLTNTSLEKLNELTLNIFNVTNEEDVLKIIN